MELQAPTTGNQLDPQVVNLAKAIRQTESGGNFKAQGKSGEYGGYQYTQPTWQADSQKFLGQNVQLQQATPQQQNEVAYKKIASLKQQGYNVGQIASIWNSGKPDWQGNVGTNKYGVKYDTPQYVDSVAKTYQQLKQGNQNPTIEPNSSTVGENQSQQDNKSQDQDPGFFGNLMKGNFGGALKNAGDFAFPIIGDAINDIQGKSQKSALQQLGDAGLSALWFVPGLGEGAGIGAHILEGAGLGYGADVASKLSQGNTDAGSILSPGFGTVAGGVAGGVLPKLFGSLGKNFTEEGAVKALRGNLGDAIGATKSGRAFLSDSATKGFDPSELLAKTNSIPDVVDGKFDSALAQENLNKNINAMGELRGQVLDKAGARGSLPILKSQLLKDAESQFSGTARNQAMQHIEDEFSAYQDQYGRQPSASDMEKIKEDLYSKTKYDATRPSAITQANKFMGNAVKTQIEKIAEKSGIPNMAEYNRLIAHHYNALEALEKIHGQVVKGGRLGNILRGHTMAGIGAIGANAFGGGFLGTVAGGLSGEAVNKIFSKIMGDTSLTNPVRDAILERIMRENPEIVQKFQQFAGKAGSVAPMLTPAISKVPGLLQGFLSKTVARGGASINQ